MASRSRLYPLLDLDCLALHGIEPLAAARELLITRPFALQLRAKGRSARETLEWLTRLAPLCQAAGVPLVANDRPDLAWLGGAEAVHIGQQDLPLSELRRLLELLPCSAPQGEAGGAVRGETGGALRGEAGGAARLGVGISTHDLGELERALVDKPDYVAFGPVFQTHSKRAPEPVVGMAGLARAYQASQRAGVPLVAIGGITRGRAVEVSAHADAVAVISELYSGGLTEVRLRAEMFKQLLGETPAAW